MHLCSAPPGTACLRSTISRKGKGSGKKSAALRSTQNHHRNRLRASRRPWDNSFKAKSADDGGEKKSASLIIEHSLLRVKIRPRRRRRRGRILTSPPYKACQFFGVCSHGFVRFTIALARGVGVVWTAQDCWRGPTACTKTKRCSQGALCGERGEVLEAGVGCELEWWPVDDVIGRPARSRDLLLSVY